MNGIHDLGGMHGFGSVEVPRNEPVFAANWERTVFAMTMVALQKGICNLDEFRFATERMDPVEYLASSYYVHWLAALEILMTEKEVDASFQSGTAVSGPTFHELVAEGASARRQAEAEPRFEAGASVRTRNLNPEAHTRLPRYARGRRGRIDLVHGAFVLPDLHAISEDELPEYLYSVRFEGRELWGPQGDSRASVCLDLWESYLEPGGHDG